MTCLMGFTVLLSFGAVAAHAQVSSREGIALQDQIMELRQQLSQVQNSAGSSGSLPAPVAAGSQSGGAGSDLVAQLLDRVNTLEAQQRDMSGQLEELTNQLKEQSAALSKQMSDMQFAAQNGGGAAAAADSPAPGKKEEATAASHATTASDEAQTPEAALKAGNASLLKHDYSAAQESAQSAIAHGKGAVKIDAQYLLGQSLAGQKQYRDSTVAYFDAYKLSPKGAKAPYALLGVSSALISLGNKKAACQALAKLKAEFPSPSERVAKSTAYFSKQGECS
jgi:TolA-binding protein